ncbi:hypothetical protein MMC12_004510 [Toensbergia leucococca]|nr:hypothetical protein [Toensbergia leucococca]
MLYALYLLSLTCFLGLAHAHPSVIAPSTTVPIYQNFTTTYPSLVAGVTAPPNQCGQCVILFQTEEYDFSDDDEVNCTAATVFETVFTGNGTLVTSASTMYTNASSCTPDLFENGDTSPVTPISGGVIVDGFTLTYGHTYDGWGEFDIGYSTWSSNGPGVSSTCVPPSFSDRNNTGFPYLGFTGDGFMVDESTPTAFITTGTSQYTAPSVLTFLSLINATGCRTDTDGEPSALQKVNALTITSSFTAKAIAVITSSTNSPPTPTIIDTDTPPPSTSPTTASPPEQTIVSVITPPTPTASEPAVGSATTSPSQAANTPISIVENPPSASSIAPQELSNPSAATVAISALLAGTTAPVVATTNPVFSTAPSSPAIEVSVGVATSEPTQESSGQVTSQIPGGSAGTLGSAPAIGSESNVPVTANILASNSQVPGSASSPNGQATSLSPSPPLLTFAGSTIAPNSASQYVVGSQTLAPGSAAITVGGTEISLAPSATALIIGGSTQAVQVTEQASLPLITIAGSVITPNSASRYVVGTQTLAPGSPAITVSGSAISLAPSATALIVGGITQTIQAAGPVNLPVLTIAGSAITPNPASQYIVGSQTLVPGSAIVVSGTTISLAPSASALVAFNGITSAPQPTISALTIGGTIITPNAAGKYVVGSQTLAPGSPITLSGTTISVAASGSAIVINGVTSTLQPSPSALTIGGTIITPNAAGQYVVGSQTLTPGSAITVSDTTISLAASGSAIVVNGVTSTPQPAPSALTIAGTTVTPNAAGQYVVGSQTLTPGSAITVSGTTISLAPSGSAVIINGVTSNLYATPSLLAIAGLTLTPTSGSKYIVGSQTLSPGEAITVSGTVVSLAPGASDIVVGGSTQVLQSHSQGLGGLIYSGLGGSATKTGAAQFTGMAKKKEVGLGAAGLIMMGMILNYMSF